MYELLTGPILWAVCIFSVAGLAWRVVWYIRGLSWKLDRVAYRPHLGKGLRGAGRSIYRWLIPFGSIGWKAKPLFTIIFFAFHIGLIGVPLFLEGHAVMLKESFGISWPTMPMWLADGLTITAIVAGVLLFVRRMALPEVRIITDWHDIMVLIIALAPFVTGFMAVHQLGDYEFWLTAHVIAGEVMIAALPFTKLYHVVGFFLSRGQLGMDFAIKRGGDTKDFAW